MEVRFSRYFVGVAATLLFSVAFIRCGNGPSPRVTFTPTRPPSSTATPSVPPATVSRTVTETATGTPSPTVTRTDIPPVLCGNGIVQGTETCDDGGTCWNGPNAGMRCPATVEGGVDCTAPGLCRPAGGDGCAENCTVETIVDFPLGDKDTSKSFVSPQGDIFAISAPVYGHITFRAGQPRPDVVETTGGKIFNPGDIPVVETVLDNRWAPQDPDRGIAPIAVAPGIDCTCTRGIALKSCGALLPDGPGFFDCTPKCLASDGTGQCAGGSNSLEPCISDQDCPGGSCGQGCNPDLGPEQCLSGFTCTNRDGVCVDDTAACDFVYGPGNQASGVIGCGPTGPANVDYVVTSGPATGQDTRTFSGGPTAPGAALISTSTMVGHITNSDCALDPSQVLNGPDGLPCTDDDPDKGGEIPSLLFTTGTARAESGSPIGPLAQVDPVICVGLPCDSVSGRPFVCDALQQSPLSTGGASLAAAHFEPELAPLVSGALLTKYVSIDPTSAPTPSRAPTLTPTPG